MALAMLNSGTPGRRAIDDGGSTRPFVVIATAQLLNQRIVVGQAIGEQMRLVGVHLDDIGAAAAFDRGGDPRRHVVHR